MHLPPLPRSPPLMRAPGIAGRNSAGLTILIPIGGSKAFENTHSDHFDFDHDNVGGGVYKGYQITPWLAVEGGYDFLGNMQIKGQHGAGAQMKTQGLQMSLKASYALTNDWDIYGRAGLC